MFRRLTAGLAVVVVLVLVVVGGLWVGGLFPDDAHVEDLDARVTVNDEVSLPETGADGTTTCTHVGPPPDSLAVAASFTVHSAVERADVDDTYQVEVSLANRQWSYDGTVEVYGTERVEVLRTLPDDESLAPGDTATVGVRVSDGWATVASASERVRVGEGGRYVDCG